MRVPNSTIKKGILFLLLILPASTFIYAQAGRITGGQIPETRYDNLLQGRIYFPIYPSVNGSQYLMKDWSKGNVLLQGRWYTDLPLLYDIYADDLIYLSSREESFDLIRLVKPYIQRFNLGDRQFINLTYSHHLKTGLAAGFYEVKVEGKVSYLIKRRLEIITERAVSSFLSKDIHYLIYNGQAYRMRNKRSLLPLIGAQHKKMVYSFLKKGRIRLKKSGDVGWRKVALYLNSLQLD